MDIIYGELRLRADHVQYNTATSEAVASGHVQFDYQNQHIDCDSAQLNVQTGHGTFHNVRGFVKLERRPNPTLLITQNPLYFQADEVVRLNEERYDIHHGWMTICDPLQPTWQFYAPNAKLRLGKQVALVNANFRLYRVPLVWLPYATTPAGNRVRQTGFLIPNIGQSNSKGLSSARRSISHQNNGSTPPSASNTSANAAPHSAAKFAPALSKTPPSSTPISASSITATPNPTAPLSAKAAISNKRKSSRSGMTAGVSLLTSTSSPR